MRKDGELSYTRYSREELEEALFSIDARTYPLNHANLRAEIARRDSTAPESAAEPSSRQGSGANAETPAAKAEKEDKAAIGAIMLCLMFVAFGIHGIANDDLRFSWKHRELVSGDAAWVFFAAIVVCLLGNVGRLVGINGEGESGQRWRTIGNAILAVGMVILVAAFVVDYRQG